MKTKIKIIKALIESKEPVTIRDIGKRIHVRGYGIVHGAIQQLLQEGAIILKKAGKSSLCSLNDNYYGFEVYRAEEERKGALLKNKNLKQLYREVMSKVDTSFFIFLLFGSYASGQQTKSSDIDLMLISNDEDFEEKMNNILSLLPLKTHTLIFNEKEFTGMKDSKDSNVVKEAMGNRIILYGIENYYKLKSA